MWRRHRFKILITVALVALISVSISLLIIASKDQSEPTYGGLTMFQWVAGPDTPIKQHALLTLGADNVHLLVNRMNYEPAKDRIYKLYLRLPAQLQKIKWLNELCKRKFNNASVAQFVLVHIGPHAAPAVPELSLIGRSGSPQLAHNTLFTLKSIGEPAVPGIIAGMSHTDQNVRRFALFLLEGYTYSPIAWQALTNALADPDPKIREQAANIIQRSGRLQ
jgi:hypothetical protein